MGQAPGLLWVVANFYPVLVGIGYVTYAGRWEGRKVGRMVSNVKLAGGLKADSKLSMAESGSECKGDE